MKDVSIPSTRHSRASQVYPKKRPSPHGGIAKPSSNRTPFLPTQPHRRVSPQQSAKAAVMAQRQRDAQVNELRRQGVLLEEEYREEIQYYMMEMERDTMSSQQSMDMQPEIKWHMRPCLVDFLVEIHFSFRLRPETLYLTLNIIDRYVSRRIVFVKHYQLVGCAALWIAAKFEDAKERVPTVQELSQICRETYDESAFLQMEGHVLATIQWTVGHPTAEAWLRIMCCGPCIEDTKVQHVARFLMEITLFHREFVTYTPSTVALGSLTLARYICGKNRLVFEETEECLEIVELLDERLAKQIDDISETLVKKYSYAFYSKAAQLVIEFYLQGGRFTRQAPITLSLPTTPQRVRVSSIPSTPSSLSRSESDMSDDMPMTPTSPCFTTREVFTGARPFADKENLPSIMQYEPAIIKPHHEIPPAAEQYPQHDYTSVFGRSALQSLNVSSPRMMVA